MDWSFPTLTNSGLHSFHWYPATYLSAIPGTLIPFLSQASSTVLDPFCGSGTTGMEAVRLGRKFLGVDTNPVALLMSEAKLSFVSPRLLRAAAADVISRSQGVFARKGIEDHPNQLELLRWYHPETAATLNRLLQAILCVNGELPRTTLLAIYSAILKSCSSQSRHWGWVCDNVTPKPGELVFKDAASLFVSSAVEFARESERAFRAALIHSGEITRTELRRRSLLLSGDCINRLRDLDEGSVDLIVTSPPYYGVADYVKSQRLSYLWFDRDELAGRMLGFRDFEQLRALEAGARSARHRANSHSLYLSFMETFFREARRVLRPGAPMALVIGESKSRAATIEDIVVLARDAGYKLEARLGRSIKATRRRLMAKVQGEAILVFSVSG